VSSRATAKLKLSLAGGDDAFLRFLELMEEEAKREKELNAPRSAKLIEHEKAVEAEIVPIQVEETLHLAHRKTDGGPQ
jgi:hypothetical protein